MKFNLIKISLAVILFSFMSISSYAAGFTPKDSTIMKSMKHMKMDTSGYQAKCSTMDKNLKTGSMKSSKQMTAKVINLKAIDKNKDGKVYQCPMDWDVLSDKPGKDPKCGMEMVEVTLKQAKKNLTDHGFKVK